jgi:hypothetical protein
MRLTSSLTAVLTALLAALPAASAQAEARFMDDRSTPTALVASLYNALNRHEYLRGWSYFHDGAAAPYAAFRDGYQDTGSIDVNFGDPQSEGAAGTIYTRVPVAIRAHRLDGTQAYFSGCYTVAQVQPAVQDLPPYIPMLIREAHLTPARSLDIDASACQP